MSFDASTTVSIGQSTKKSDYDRLRENDAYMRSGTADFYGPKTFYSGIKTDSIDASSATNTVFLSGIKTDTINSRTATNGVKIDSFYSNESGTISTISFTKKICAIGTWNMTANASVNLTIAGIDKTKIRSVQVLVNGDTGIDSFNLEEAGYWKLPGVGSVTIQLLRYSSDTFDTINFNSTANRGYVVFDYEE